MKKRLILIIVFALCAFSLSAEPEPIDVVVMLDTSESVLPIYEDLVNYIVKNVLTNHVRFGDTFHLISFDSKPELIYSRQLRNSDDLEEVVAALFLLNPLGKHTDLILALKFLNQHVSALSDSGNSEIIILTDGIHDPPEGSPFMTVFGTDAEGRRVNLLEQEIKSITRNGWNVSLVKLPENGKTDNKASGNGNNQTFSSSSDNTGKIDSELNKTENTEVRNNNRTGTAVADNRSDSSSQSDEISETLNITDKTNYDEEDMNQSGNTSDSAENENNIFSFTDSGSSKIYQTDFKNDTEGNNTATGSPRIKYPAEIGKIKYHFSLPVEIENFYNKPILLKLEKVLYSGMDILKEKVNIRLNEKQNKKVSIDMQLPYSIEPGLLDIDVKLVFSDRNRAYPESAEIKAELKKSFSDFVKDINIIFKIIFIAAIAVVLIIFFFIFFSSFIHVSVRDSYKVIKKDFEEMSLSNGKRPLALKVIGQNDYKIGTGNIHSFKDNSVKSFGGGHSAYNIFLYKLPSHIAEVCFTDEKYILRIKDKKYFPEIMEDETEIVTEEIINIKTDNSMKIECYFYEYISPLEKINTIMKLTDHRGMPDNRILNISR